MFTSAGDVWSFGILLWEITTLGAAPYPTIQNDDILSLITKGYRMPKPEACSDELYKIILQCWDYYPDVSSLLLLADFVSVSLFRHLLIRVFGSLAC
jgi:hypothetical protein